MKTSHVITNFSDLAPRKVINKVSYLFNKKEINALYDTVKNIDIHSDEYCSAMAAYADRFLYKKDLLCNFEEPTLEKIAKSDMPVIYVMNHSKQTRDPSMLMLFNAILNVEYLSLGKAAKSPRPKIIINANIVKSQCREMQEIYEKCGAVGVDITSKNPNNAGAIFSIIKGYLKGQNNIFIFPEGKNCVKKHLPFEERFQDGISRIIERIISLGKTVKVVPLGFSYGKEKGILGSMYIGKPIYFKKSGDRVITNSANTSSEFATQEVKNLFRGKSIKEIKGIKGISAHIIENMKICMKEAKLNLINPNSIAY